MEFGKYLWITPFLYCTTPVQWWRLWKTEDAEVTRRPRELMPRGPPPFWVGWCFSGVFGVWIRWLQSSNSCWICSSRSCARVEPGQRVAAVSKLVDTKLKGRKPPILLVLNTIVSPYLPLFLILTRRIPPASPGVNRYFRVKAKKIWRKTAIHDWRYGS